MFNVNIFKSKNLSKTMQLPARALMSKVHVAASCILSLYFINEQAAAVTAGLHVAASKVFLYQCTFLHRAMCHIASD
jgi:hypothetical protein